MNHVTSVRHPRARRAFLAASVVAFAFAGTGWATTGVSGAAISTGIPATGSASVHRAPLPYTAPVRVVPLGVPEEWADDPCFDGEEPDLSAGPPTNPYCPETVIPYGPEVVR